MPEKPLTVATYAAGASLAAITLFYVFAPNYFLDGDSTSARKKGVVGLSNPANDCFINSVLQALAGLTDLRIYLIRENHRRKIDEPWVYREVVEDPAYKNNPEWKTQGLQGGIVTKGLKEILDALNERPIYKKTISAAPFIRALENAFRQRISRQQQDAQEFLQVVAERLCDEYHAGRRARQAAKDKGEVATTNEPIPIDGEVIEERLAKIAINGNGSTETATGTPKTEGEALIARLDDEDGFPMEGKYESQIECQKCGFKPKPTESTFCTLTLNVPQSSSTSLNTCLDGLFKTEYIDDFKCEKCRLVYAKELLEAQLSRSKSESFKASTEEAITKLQHAIDTDPEQPPPDVELPPMKDAPTCKIAKHTRLTGFPKVMAIHLSRSIYNSISQKNSAKVSFPEQLIMGSLLNRKKYKLLGTVTHKGSHHSGHYESFRRQNISLPFSTPNAFQASDVFAKSAVPSPASTPRVAAMRNSGDPSPVASTPDLALASSETNSLNISVDNLPTDSTSQPSQASNGRSSSRRSPPFSATKDRESDSISLRSVAASARSTVSRISQSARNSRPGSPAGKVPVSSSSTTTTTNGKAASSKTNGAKPKRRKQNDRWWRISDEKIKEAKTSEVLGMQREVYLLFYELVREGPAEGS
ncbi:cysteine proteinase [Hypoxylon fuscum]|nr:cysteine proteinase [Hypoxylon fuscum]